MEPSFEDRDAVRRAHPDDLRHEWDERHLARFARTQDGVVELWQLSALGLSREARHTRLRQHRLVRVHHRVYGVGGVLLTERGAARAAVAAAGRGALLSHRGAARLLGLWERPVPVLDVTVPRPRAPRIPGVRVHRTYVLMPADETHVRGIPCTSVSRTIVDLAATEAPPVVEAVFERAERRRLVRAGEIENLLVRRRRAPGADVVRDLLATHRSLSGPTRSILERRLLAALRRARMPEPVVNGRLELGELVIEPDLMWPGLRVLVELDGGATHALRRARRRDNRRDREALRAGWTPLRFTWDDVAQDVAGVLAEIRDALRRAEDDQARHGR